MSLPYTRKQLGQHWLTDIASLEAIADAAAVSPGETLLEIGPGTGTLTEVLLEKNAEVVALEFDSIRAKELSQKYQANPKINIIEGDIRSFDFSTLQSPYKIVANIPYYLTANLLRKLVDDADKPSVASLLVQKEVAERVAAGPGSLSQVAVFVQVFYEVNLGELVPAYLFTPPPKVDSQVLILKLRGKPLIDIDDTFFRLVNAGFSEKRKKLRSSLSGGLQLPKTAIEEALSGAGLGPDSRAQELSVPEWHKLKIELFPTNT